VESSGVSEAAKSTKSTSSGSFSGTAQSIPQFGFLEKSLSQGSVSPSESRKQALTDEEGDKDDGFLAVGLPIDSLNESDPADTEEVVMMSIEDLQPEAISVATKRVLEGTASDAPTEENVVAVEECREKRRRTSVEGEEIHPFIDPPEVLQ
jgi:hypothetical protein